MRHIKAFSETDSLAINDDTNEAWFFTKCTPEDFLGRFGRIAAFSGCIPQFEELVARDWISNEFDDRAYAEIKRYETGHSGEFLLVPSGGNLDELELVFLAPAYVPFELVPTRVVTVSYDFKEGIRIDVGQGEDIPYSIVTACSSFRAPDFAEAHLVGGERGVAKLNETHEHCKGHMENALRVYNAAGEYVWIAEDGLQGAWGLWARDLNRDGVDELLVIAEDHGIRRLLVFGIEMKVDGM